MAHNNRKQEQRWKKQKVPRRTKQLELFAGTRAHVRTVNGFYCRLNGQQIDTATCIVYQTREPGNCFGCGQFKS
jgi:hypothetical protein